jgi:hypothetical protein
MLMLAGASVGGIGPTRAVVLQSDAGESGREIALRLDLVPTTQR